MRIRLPRPTFSQREAGKTVLGRRGRAGRGSEAANDDNEVKDAPRTREGEVWGAESGKERKLQRRKGFWEIFKN